MIYEPEKGMNFYFAAEKAKEQLKEKNSLYLTMSFNDIYVTVSVDSNLDDLATIYDLKNELRRLKK